MRLLRFVAIRLSSAVLVLLVVTFVSFLVFYVLPTDPAQLACGRPCTPEGLANARDFMGIG